LIGAAEGEYIITSLFTFGGEITPSIIIE